MSCGSRSVKEILHEWQQQSKFKIIRVYFEFGLIVLLQTQENPVSEVLPHGHSLDQTSSFTIETAAIKTHYLNY